MGRVLPEKKWLIVWYSGGKMRDGVERFSKYPPSTWSRNRCNVGETYRLFDITDPDTEVRVRAYLVSSSAV
jgi:hypothetical protein